MIQNNANEKNLKTLRKKESEEKEAKLRELCEAMACERFGGKDKMKELSNQYKGLWFLPIINDDGSIEKLGILKPIDRHILSLASSKMEEGGLYLFLEAAMNECWVDGDKEILEDDEYFLPAAGQFNKIIETKKAAFLKR